MDKNYKKEASKDEAAIPQSRKVSFIVLVGLFFIWGFIISMNDILIPYLKEVFEFFPINVSSVFFFWFLFYRITHLFYNFGQIW